jgi:hypothetical protein
MPWGDHLSWPPPQLLAPLSATAAAVAEQAASVRAAAAAAVADYEATHPGGSQWQQAAAADRAHAGPPPKRWQVQVLLAEQPARYAAALALTTALPGRLDELRGRLAGDEKLLQAVGTRLDELNRDMYQAAVAARDTARDPDATRSAQHTALETFQGLAGQARHLTGLKRWLVGLDTGYVPPTTASVDRATYAAYMDARETLDPPEDGRGWRDRDAAARRQQPETVGGVL